MPTHAAACRRSNPPVAAVRRSRRIGMVLLAAMATAMLFSVAHAYWTAGGVGSGSASTGTITPPSGVAATSPQWSNSVTVTWGAAVPSTGGAVTGYYVTRAPAGGGTSSPACGTSPAALTSTLQCDDLSVTNGDYRYVVTAVLGSWTAQSTSSNSVTVLYNIDAPTVTATTTPTPNANGFNRTSPVSVGLSATDSHGISRIVYAINGGSPVTVNSATASVPLSGNGTWTVTYSAVDTLGRSSPTGTHVVRIDTIAPAAPAAPTLDAASDSGISSSDGVTNIRTPTFTGTAEPGSTVRLFSDGTLVGSTVASVSGAYTVTSGSLLAEGTRSITVRAVDPADNVSTSSPSTSITIDVTAPAAPGRPKLMASSDSGRSNNDFITNDNTPTMWDNASGAGAIQGVSLYANDVLVGTSTATPDYTVTSSLLADGVYTMTVRGSDTAGNLSAASLSRSLTIDTVAPAAPSAPTLTAASDTGSSSTDRVTSNPTPTVTGTNEASAIVTLYAGATQVGSQTTASTTYSITSTALSEGQHTLTATATDTAGNLGPASPGTTITVDTTAPTAPSAPVLTAASDSGTSSSDGITNINTPTFTGTATAGTNVTLHTGSTATGGAVNATNGGWTATTGTLADGNHVITARTDPDLAGNVGISPSTTVTIDTAAPATPAAPALTTASDSGRSTSDGITNVTTPTFFDTGSTGVVGVRLYDGGIQVGSATASPSYMVTSTALADGAHSMTVRVLDLAGNLSVSSAVRSVTIDTAAPSAPAAPTVEAASDSGASSTDGVTNDNTPTVVGSNESSARVIVYDGPTQVGTHTTTSASYSVTTSVLSDGNHTLTATATDIAGNTGPASAGTTVTIDTAAPTAPSAPTLTAASDSGVSSTDLITNVTTPTFTGTAPSGSNVRLFDGDSATGATVVAGGGSYTATSGTLASGTRTITARTDPDLAGNVGISVATTVVVDTAAPTVSVSPNTSTSATRFNVTFNENVDGFTSADVSLSGTANPTTSTLTGTGPSYIVQVTGMDRTGTVVVNLGAGVVTDVAGNANTTSASSSTGYTDAQAPDVAVTRFVASGQTAVIEGTVGTGPGDPSTVTVVLCAVHNGSCPSGDTRATLTAPVNAATGTWSVTSGTLSSTANLYARAHATDLSGNTRTSNSAGPITIP